MMAELVTEMSKQQAFKSLSSLKRSNNFYSVSRVFDASVHPLNSVAVVLRGASIRGGAREASASASLRSLMNITYEYCTRLGRNTAVQLELDLQPSVER